LPTKRGLTRFAAWDWPNTRATMVRSFAGGQATLSRQDVSLSTAVGDRPAPASRQTASRAPVSNVAAGHFSASDHTPNPEATAIAATAAVRPLLRTKSSAAAAASGHGGWGCYQGLPEKQNERPGDGSSSARHPGSREAPD
jgi:hypothetical protein